jgi:hypothetical protein
MCSLKNWPDFFSNAEETMVWFIASPQRMEMNLSRLVHLRAQ